MQEKIELRLRRDFGGIIEDYFLFTKQNMKTLLDMFFRYNGVLLIFVLIACYLFVTGFLDFIQESDSGFSPSTDSQIMFGLGTGIFVLLLLFLTIFNYSLGASYISVYQDSKTSEINPAEVFKLVKRKMGILFVMLIIGFFVYIFMLIFSIILAFIPILGSIVQYVMMLAYMTWIGLAIMHTFYENQGAIESFTESWSLMFSGFWKAIGINLVLGIILNLVMLMISFMPMLLLFIYIFHSVENNIDIYDSWFAKILFMISLTAIVLLVSFWQVLSQLINGFLYFNLHENKYNVYTRSKIDEIGIKETV